MAPPECKKVVFDKNEAQSTVKNHDICRKFKKISSRVLPKDNVFDLE